MKRMNAEGTKTIDKGVLVFDGHKDNPTVEGPKIYKRNGYYYIFAPAGGVKEGWQLVLRSKNCFGPYEVKKVLHQGNTKINGPHQGAWIETSDGESWFFHFQDRGAFGRVVHLQPVEWKDDWPEIGVDNNKDGIGEPVLSFRKPLVDKEYSAMEIPASDEFNLPSLGLQWQWQANPKASWGFPCGNSGYMQLYAVPVPDSCSNLSMTPNLLLQKLPGPAFSATAKLSFYPGNDGEKTGLLIMGGSYAYMGLESKEGITTVIYSECYQAFDNSREAATILDTISEDIILFRVNVAEDAACQFSYSINGIDFIKAQSKFVAQPGKWIGAKIGFFCTGEKTTNNAGYVNIDWFRVERK